MLRDPADYHTLPSIKKAITISTCANTVGAPGPTAV